MGIIEYALLMKIIALIIEERMENIALYRNSLYIWGVINPGVILTETILC